MTPSPTVAALVKTYQPYYETPQDGLIGWGHTLVGEHEFADYGNGLSVDQAEALLQQDIVSAAHRLNATLRRAQVTLLQNQYDALVCLALDAKQLEGTFILKKAIAKNTEAVVAEFTKWGELFNNGATANRREAESRLFSTGVF